MYIGNEADLLTTQGGTDQWGGTDGEGTDRQTG